MYSSMKRDAPKRQRRSVYKKVATLGALLVSTCWVAAQEQTDPEALREFTNNLPQQTLHSIARNKSQFLQMLTGQLYAYAPSGILTREILDTVYLRTIANRRADELRQFLALDLNGDWFISEPEIQRQMDLLDAGAKARISIALETFDADGDAGLSGVEVMNFVKSQEPVTVNRERFEQLFHFDFNGDDSVDLGEIVMVLNAIDPEALEAAASHRVPYSARAHQQQVPKCQAPEIPKGHELVALIRGDGSALSNVPVYGEDGASQVATFIVEPGETPLYVFALVTKPLVLKMEGATERISQMVVQPRATAKGPGAAVHGISRDSVLFVQPDSCVTRYRPGAPLTTERVSADLTASLSAKVDHFVADNAMDHLHIPSGKPAIDQQPRATHPYRNPIELEIDDTRYRLSAEGMVELDGEGQPTSEYESERRTIRELMRFNPGGLEIFDADDLVSSAELKPYSLLPQQAGLLQLMAEGKLEHVRGEAYRLLQSISEYPGGLNGAHSVTFLIPKGVGLPDDVPGHSAVIIEETGECILGALCRIQSR